MTDEIILQSYFCVSHAYCMIVVIQLGKDHQHMK